MKTLQLKLSNLGAVFLILLALAVSSCSEVKEHKEDPDQITETDIRIMKEKHLITLNDAVNAYKKYGKDRVKLLKDTLKEKYKDKHFEDTRNVWVDIKTLKTYIKYVEDNASDAKGLQFYFSVDSDKDSGKKKNHQTFFIAPTVENVMGKDTIQSGFTFKNGKRVFLYEAFKKYLDENQSNIQKGSFFNTLQDNDGYLFNDMEGTPPGGNN